MSTTVMVLSNNVLQITYRCAFKRVATPYLPHRSSKKARVDGNTGPERIRYHRAVDKRGMSGVF